MTIPEEYVVSWDELLKEWGIASWQLQRLVSNPHRKLPVAHFNNFWTSPTKRRCPPIVWTELEFGKFVGNNSDVFFDRRVVEQFRDENPDLIRLTTEDCFEWELEHDWSTFYTWDDLISRWGFLEQFRLVERFYLSTNKLHACWWHPDCPRFDQRVSDLGYINEDVPDLSDLLFCRKHMKAYERHCFKEFPNNIYLAVEYEFIDKPIILDAQPESVYVFGDKPNVGVSSTESGQQSLSDPEWGLYKNEMRKIREKGKYTDKQAHYWRSRAVFRYLNPTTSNTKQAAKQEDIKTCLRSNYPEIIKFGCENVHYDSVEIERWLTQTCPQPDMYDESPKPWENFETEKTRSQEDQIRRPSRHRECVQAIGLIILFRNKELTQDAFIRACSHDYLRNILDSIREDDLKDSEKVKPTENKIKFWLKTLIKSFYSISERNK